MTERFVIVLRWDNGGNGLCLVTDGDEDSDNGAVYPSENAAQSWVDNSAICQSGQVVATICEID